MFWYVQFQLSSEQRNFGWNGVLRGFIFSLASGLPTERIEAACSKLEMPFYWLRKQLLSSLCLPLQVYTGARVCLFTNIGGTIAHAPTRGRSMFPTMLLQFRYEFAVLSFVGTNLLP